MEAALVGEILPHQVPGLPLLDHLLAGPGLEAVAAGVSCAEGGLLEPGSHRTDVGDQGSDSTLGQFDSWAWHHP